MDEKIHQVLVDFVKSYFELLGGYLMEDIAPEDYDDQKKMLVDNYVLKMKNVFSLHRPEDGTGGSLP